MDSIGIPVSESISQEFGHSESSGMNSVPSECKWIRTESQPVTLLYERKPTGRPSGVRHASELQSAASPMGSVAAEVTACGPLRSLVRLSGAESMRVSFHEGPPVPGTSQLLPQRPLFASSRTDINFPGNKRTGSNTLPEIPPRKRLIVLCLLLSLAPVWGCCSDS